MAVSEAMSGRRARGISRPAARYRPPLAYRGRRRLVRGRIPKGGNLSGPVDEYLQPLCPLRDGDEGRYLDIDSSEQRFTDFKTAFANPDNWMAKGHLVVVTGDRGYGKTSLIQRCAFWLREEVRPGKVVVVDLSDERWPETDTIEDRLRRTFDLMMDTLGADALEGHEVTRIKSHADLMESYWDLGRVLSARFKTNKPILLVTLLQGYPRPAEVERYYMLARPGMFFFAELFEREDTANITEMMPKFNKHFTDVHHLAMNVVKAGDADLLVDWIRRQGGNWPEVPSEVRDHFDNIAQYNVGMAQLSKLTWGTLAVAAAESAPIVTVDHVVKYFAQDRYQRTV